jgi:hypothetical protein
MRYERWVREKFECTYKRQSGAQNLDVKIPRRSQDIISHVSSEGLMAVSISSNISNDQRHLGCGSNCGRAGFKGTMRKHLSKAGIRNFIMMTHEPAALWMSGHDTTATIRMSPV